jgi:hypothetical protein
MADFNVVCSQVSVVVACSIALGSVVVACSIALRSGASHNYSVERPIFSDLFDTRNRADDPSWSLAEESSFWKFSAKEALIFEHNKD